MINFLFWVWVSVNLLLLIHVLHELGLVYSALRSRKKTYTELAEESVPFVTIQLPLFNEKYVVERLLEVISEIDYPKDKLEVQILDDSTDETSSIIKKWLIENSASYFVHIQRKERIGFKAGALAYGLSIAKGEFIAIFDADFVPKSCFLKKTIPFFIDVNVGVVQTKWAHLNEEFTFITRAQAIMLNTHFSIEQLGRHQAKGFINFNGTAGVWRKLCIEDSGGWQADTLTEDLDLSFRAQARNWKFEYLFDVHSPAELPVTFDAYKTQQFRWSKGAAECLHKNFKLLWKSQASFKTKLMGTFHLLNSSIYLLVILLLMLSPVVHYFNSNGLISAPFIDYFSSIGLIVSASLLLIFFIGSVLGSSNKFKSILFFIPSVFIFFSMTTGISLYMALGVLEGYFGKKSEFVRTPKFGSHKNSVKKVKLGYDFKKESNIRILEFICLTYGAYWMYIGIIDFNPIVLIYSLIILTGFSLSIFFSKTTFKWNK